MPLLNKEPFSRIPLPENIDSDDEVYYCSSTQEAFTDYEQFFERAILCSSMVWTCSVTGRSGLTFQEAVDSERSAKSLLNSFPKNLQAPILFLVTCINEHKLSDIVNMIIVFISNRYFVGEETDVVVNDRKIKGRIVRVIPPTEQDLIKSNIDNKNVTVSYGCDPALYKYEIEDVSNTGLKVVVGAERVSRSKGTVSKDKVKLFLKQHIAAEKRFQVMKVKETSVIKYDIDSVRWKDIFAGPLPNFASETQVVRTFLKDKAKFIKDGHKSSNKKSKAQSNNCSTPSIKEIFKPIDKELLKQQKVEQKIIERQRLKEERKKAELILKEWNKKREDFECDDLQPLPLSTAVDCCIPNEFFGDSIMIMEFFRNFRDLLNFKVVFPDGITFEILQEILTSKAIYGPFGDLLEILLRTIFALQEEENLLPILPEQLTNSDEESENESGGDNQINAALKAAKSTSNTLLHCHGITLNNTMISPFTVTEILRLHILSSGAGKQKKTLSGREDPCLWLKKDNPQLIGSLLTSTVFELSIADRLKILHALIHQVSSFTRFREFIEETADKVSELKRQLRDLEKLMKPEAKEEKSNGKQSKKETADSQNSVKRTNPENSMESRLRSNKKLDDLKCEIRKLQGCYRLKPLGIDRWSRKYWWFNSIEGLFVESEDLKLSTCTSRCSSLQDMALKTKCVVTLHDIKNSALTENTCYSYLSNDDRSTASDKENDCTTPPKSVSKSERSVSRKDASKQTLVHLLKDGKIYCVSANSDITTNVKWSFYYDMDHVESLISSLNNRGFRESELKKVLQRETKSLTQSLRTCPRRMLNANVQDSLESKLRKRTFVRFNPFKLAKFADFSSEKALEAAFKHHCLQMEKLMFDGGLCVVEFRNEWRSALEDENETLPLHECIQYLVTLSSSICPQFLTESFRENGVIVRWKESLQNSTSYSQLFFHLMTLNENIVWSKSASEAQCIVCSKKKNQGKMLLCDECNSGFHIYCLKPPLEDIPEGEWYCNSCAELRKPLSPRKVRQNGVKYAEESTGEESDECDPESEESSDSSSSSSSESESTGDSGEESDDDVKCFVCEKGKIEIYCSKCGASFHNSCHTPPITRPQRKTWVCFKCHIEEAPKRETKTEETNNEPQPKRMKLRYNQDYDYESGKPIDNKISKPTHNLRQTRISKSSLSPKCVELLKKMKHHQDAVHFRSNPTADNAPKYNNIVKRHVDFNLITSKLDSGDYKSDHEFILDIYLILQNCWLYWGKASEPYIAGKRLFEFFKHLLSEYGFERFKGSLH